MNPRVVVQPTVEPITLEEARWQCGVVPYDSPPSHPDDDLIMDAVSAAREYVENHLGFAITDWTLEYVLDEFPDDDLELLIGPVVSVESIKYIDDEGDEQTLDEADYILYTHVSPAIVTIDAWPATDDVLGAVRVRYVVGPSSDSPPTPIPRLAMQAVKLLTAHFYRNREATTDEQLESVPLGVEALLSLVPGRIRKGFA